MKNIAIFFVLVFSIASCKQANEIKLTDWVIQNVESIMKAENIPAISIGLIQEGKLLSFQNFGTTEREADTKVDEQTIYQIASLSKTFTGIIVNNLIEEGKLKIEEPIVSYLSEVLNNEANVRLKNVTVKNLLQHQAGIPNDACALYRNRKDGDAWLNGYSEEELIQDLNEIQLDFEPGTNWSYSNSGYAILGYICEIVAQKKYDELLKLYVVERFELENTTVALNEIQKNSLATPYRKDDRSIATHASVMGMTTPASAIYSNVEDLSKLMLETMNTYAQPKPSGPLFLTKHMAQSDMEILKYGFGLMEISEQNGTIYVHDGDADGFASMFLFSPEKNAGIVLLTTSGGPWVKNLSMKILGGLIDEKALSAKSKKSMARTLLNLIKKKGIQEGLDFFEKNKDGDEYLVDGDEMNGLGYKLLGAKKMKEALAIFKLNIELFPSSANAYDSLGEAYMTIGNKELAIKNYKKSVELDPNNANGFKMLEQLKK